MDTGDVQVQHQPSTQDPTRQPWSNNNSNSKQVKQRKESSNSSNSIVNSNYNNSNGNKNKNDKKLNLINVEHSQNSAKINGTKSSITTPKISQNFIVQQAPKSVTFINKNSSQLNPSKSSLPSYNNNNNLSKSPPKSNKNIITTVQQKTTNYNRSIPKPLNLSKTTQFQNLARAPQTATFPQKINRSYNLPNPPKTATFPKHSNGFPKDIRQPTLRFPTTSFSTTNNSQHTYTLMCNEQYLNALELTRNRNYNFNSIPVRFTTANCHQVEPSPSTSVVVLNHPDDSDSQGSSPPTPRFLSSENSSDSTDIYDVYNMQYYPYEDELLLDDSQQYYYYCHYDQSQEYINPSTSASNLHQQQCSNIVPATKDERRKSVFGGPMKIHPDAILPIRQPKGPEMSKNFATRIRRKAVNKLHAAAANRRRKSAADRRKSAIF